MVYEDIKLLANLIKDKNRLKGQIADINRSDNTFIKLDVAKFKIREHNVVISKNGVEVVRRRFEWNTTADFTKSGTTFTGALIFTDNKIRGDTGWQ